MSRLPIIWGPREPPLLPVAVLGRGSVAGQLAHAVGVEIAPSLRFAASDETLLILGEDKDLPWADGAHYLGRDGGLLVPTTRAPSVPADLLRAALAEGMPGHQFAVLGRQVLAFPPPTAGADPRWLRYYSQGIAS